MKLRALIVEDCPAMRKLLLRSLAATGLAEFQFIEAQDGDDAWERFGREDIDIVFVDWNLPKVSGLEFVRKVRASPRGDRIPIVMVTGNGTTGDVQAALDSAGADVYITKPYTVDSLERKLAKVIDDMPVEQVASPEPKRAGRFSWIIDSARSTRDEGSSPSCNRNAPLEMGLYWPEVWGGTRNSITRLFSRRTWLRRYAAIRDYEGWVAVLALGAVLLAYLVGSYLRALGVGVPPNNENAALVTGLPAGANPYFNKPFDRKEARVWLQDGVRVVHPQQSLTAQVKELQAALAHVKQLHESRPDYSCCNCCPNCIAAHRQSQFPNLLSERCSDGGSTQRGGDR